MNTHIIKKGGDILTATLPNTGIECKWGIGSISNRDSGVIARNWRLLDREYCKNIYWRRLTIWHTQWRSTGYQSIAAINQLRTCEVRSDKNSYKRPCSTDRTVSHAPVNVCLRRLAACTNTPKRRAHKNLIVHSAKVTWGYFDTGDTLTQVAALFTYLLFQHDWLSSSFRFTRWHCRHGF